MATLHSLFLVTFFMCAQLVSAQGACTGLQQTTTTVTTSGCTWTWLMSYPTMSGAISTVYGSTVILDYDAIDCDICSVTNIPYEPAELAIWITTITAATPLTLSSMACLPSSTTTSSAVSSSSATTSTASDIFGPPPSVTNTSANRSSSYTKRNLPNAHARRQASTTSTAIPAMTSQEASELAQQIALALEVVSQVSDGQSLATLCSDLSNPSSLIGPSANGLNATFVQEVICSLNDAEKGTVSSISDQLANLAAVFAVIDVAATVLNTTDPNILCSVIDFPALAAYNIDWQVLKSFLCSAATSVPSTSTSSTTAVSTTSPPPGPYSTSPASPTSQASTGSGSTSMTSPYSSVSSGLPSSLSFNTSFSGATVGPVPSSSVTPNSSSPTIPSPTSSSPPYPIPSNSTSSSGASGMSGSGYQMSTGVSNTSTTVGSSSYGTAPVTSSTLSTFPYGTAPSSSSNSSTSSYGTAPVSRSPSSTLPYGTAPSSSPFSISSPYIPSGTTPSSSSATPSGTGYAGTGSSSTLPSSSSSSSSSVASYYFRVPPKPRRRNEHEYRTIHGDSAFA